MHEAVSQGPVRRKEQETRGVHVQPADGDPPALTRRRKPFENGWAPLRVPPGSHLAEWLVIKECLGRRRRACEFELPAIQPDVVAGISAIAKVRHLAGHRDTPVPDPLLYGAARAEPRLREQLLQPDHAIIRSTPADRRRAFEHGPPARSGSRS